MNTLKQQKSQYKINFLIIVVTLWTLLPNNLVAGTAVGNPGDAPTLNYLVSEAELVFQGAVVSIEYATSKPANETDLGIPYTFVTYRVDNVLKGSIDQKEVTLRFLGGLRESDGVVLKVTHMPTFNIGEEDILFVQGNTVVNRPLAQWKYGRLRVRDGKIYDNDGSEILISSQGEIQLGKADPVEKKENNSVGNIPYNDDTNLTNPNVNKEITESKAISVDEFLLAVNDELEKIGKSTKSSPASFINADPSVPFVATLPTPIRTPSVTTHFNN